MSADRSSRPGIGEIEARLGGSPVVQAARATLGEGQGVWIVGGAIRDAALGLEVVDLDLAVEGEPRAIAAAIAGGSGGHAFELSAEFETWRAAGPGWQVDMTPLRGDGLATDLGMRDFTIGAVAMPLGGGDLVDPFRGLEDLRAAVLRAVSKTTFTDDPLRLLRAARLAARFGLDLEGGTVTLAREAAPRAGESAGERQFAELRLMITGPDPLRGIALLDELGVTPIVLPELDGLRGVGQNRNHHLDVHGHTLEVLERVLEIDSNLESFAGQRSADLRDFLDQPLANEITRGGALRFAALFHDLGKPETRVAEGDRVTFIGHDEVGARLAEQICARLRTSRRLSRHLSAITLHHLHLGFMTHEMPLSRRRIHEYLSVTDPVSVDVTVLTIADRLSARGIGPIAGQEMITSHLQLASQMIAAGLDRHRDGPPQAPLDGTDVIEDLGVAPGPLVSEVLDELQAAAYADEISGRDEALRHAREFLAGR